MDFDVTILYHPGEKNVVAYALSQNVVSMESLNFLLVNKRPWLEKFSLQLIERFKLLFVSPNKVLAYVEDMSSLMEQILEQQFKDAGVRVI